MGKQKEITAYLIDTDQAKVTEIKLIPKLDAIYEAIGCDCIDIVMCDAFGIQFDVYVDDEGLLKPNDFFLVSGYPQPLAGHALVVGLENKDGTTSDAPMSLDTIRGMVKFIPKSRVAEYC